MKNAKIFKNVLSVAIAASLVAGCFALTGCDDKKDDKKDSKKSEKVDDEDEDEKEDKKKDDKKEEKETEAEETEAEETEAEETEAEETEAEETEEDEWSDWEDIDLDDIEVEYATPDDFEDEFLKELCQQYLDDGFEVVKADPSDVSYESDAGIVEAFMASTGEMSMSASFDEEKGEADGYGKMDSIIVAKFESTEKAEEFYKQYVDEIEAEGYTLDTKSEDGKNTASFEDSGMGIIIDHYTEKDVIAVDVVIDLDAMFGAWEAEYEDEDVEADADVDVEAETEAEDEE